MEDKDTRKKFFDFLEDDKSICEIKDDKHTYEIIKIPFGNHLDLLYCGWDYGNYFRAKNELSYGGIYDRESKELYCLDYTIRDNILNLSWDDNKYKGSFDIFNEINNQLQEIITDYVNENKTKFYNEVKPNYKSYASEKSVYKDFLKNIKVIKYQNAYRVDDYDILLNYLDKGKDYLYNIGLEYVMNNKEIIGEELTDIDIKNEYLTSIYNNSEHKIYKIKNIIDALKDIDSVTVRVFINKDGKDCDFKYDRKKLLDSYNSNYLDVFDISSSDSLKYEKLFGKWSDFHYEDITKMEFRNKILYEDKNFESEHTLEVDDEGMAL